MPNPFFSPGSVLGRRRVSDRVAFTNPLRSLPHARVGEHPGIGVVTPARHSGRSSVPRATARDLREMFRSMRSPSTSPYVPLSSNVHVGPQRDFHVLTRRAVIAARRGWKPLGTKHFEQDSWFGYTKPNLFRHATVPRSYMKQLKRPHSVVYKSSRVYPGVKALPLWMRGLKKRS